MIILFINLYLKFELRMSLLDRRSCVIYSYLRKLGWLQVLDWSLSSNLTLC